MIVFRPVSPFVTIAGNRATWRPHSRRRPVEHRHSMLDPSPEPTGANGTVLLIGGTKACYVSVVVQRPDRPATPHLLCYTPARRCAEQDAPGQSAGPCPIPLVPSSSNLLHLISPLRPAPRLRDTDRRDRRPLDPSGTHRRVANSPPSVMAAIPSTYGPSRRRAPSAMKPAFSSVESSAPW